MSDDVYAESEEPRKFGEEESEPGKLLTEKDEPKLAKLALKIWEAKDAFMRRKEAKWRVNELRRRGYKNVQLRQESDDLSWEAWVPPHMERAPDALSAMNKAASLCRKFVSIMWADPPAPLAIPTSGEDEDRDAAEFSTRVLEDIQSVSKLNTPKSGRKAFDRASTYGSGYVRYYVHPTEGGRSPIQISAGPLAETVEDALTDPATGMAWPDLVERFVTPDGRLTDDVSEAAHKFVPALKKEILTGRNVRLIPHTAEDIDDADGCQVAAFRPWGEIRRAFDLDPSEEDLEELFRFRPKQFKLITTVEEQQLLKRETEDKEERLVFTLTTYYKACSDYPKGACLITIGEQFAPEQRDWTETDAEGREISLMLPLTQYKQWSEGSEDANGFGMMDLVGEGNEIRAHAIGAFMDHVDTIINRKIFLPLNSIVKSKDLRLPGNTVIPINPNGEPKYQEIPAFPQNGLDLIKMTDTEMEHDTNLGQVAQGLESAQVQSGRHAQAILSQVHSGLSEIRQNIIDAYTRECTIQLQMIRAFYDAPQRIGWVGEDGAYKEKRWTGADLRATSDVKLAPGSLTMLSPIQKSALAQQYMQSGVLTQEDLKDIMAAELGGTLGLQDDRFVMRIRRQLAAWLEGPPPDWQPQFENVPATDPMTGQPVVDPMTGQPEMQPQQAMDPVLGAIWKPVPADELPYVARTRLRELAKTMCTSEYAAKPEEWKFAVVMEFQRANMPQQGLPGQQVGQPPNVQQSPEQRTQGPLSPPDTPVPNAVGEGTMVS
jgi:hypothetical protein